MEVGGDANDKSVSVKWISVGSALSWARQTQTLGIWVSAGRSAWWERVVVVVERRAREQQCQSVAGVLASERG